MIASWQHAVERALSLEDAPRWSRVGNTGWGEAWSLDSGDTRCFVKTSTGRHADMADAEADGLRALERTRTVRVPRVLGSGAQGTTSFVAVEWLDMRTGGHDARAGRALAALHRACAPAGPGAARFGWHRDNWIGGTPQRNGWSDDWCAFFRDCRLVPQLAEAARHGHGGALQRDGEALVSDLPAFFRDHDPAPSLLHGDLWSGNAAALSSGDPVVFDPAVYVGDREADIAMTELFGGFGADFHAAYREAWPLPPGYATRRGLYNLYHVLNHLNLFGGGYLARARSMASALLAELR